MDGEPGEMEMGWGSGFGATNTNCTFQPESCMCVCWPQLLFSKASVWVKSKNHNKITCLSWNLPRFCFFSVAPNLFLLFAAFADAKRFAILFRLSLPQLQSNRKPKLDTQKTQSWQTTKHSYVTLIGNAAQWDQTSE